ncbi:MAG: methylated-DNA--[protein]-cysteine S-methyltransferase [Bacteroidetes bacterium]|nr:methylated-DNA--[protein]-cysteine S-methyltransferase [Bacteroidota bacterium]
MNYCLQKIEINKLINNKINTIEDINLLLVSNKRKLVGIYVLNQKHFPKIEENWVQNRNSQIFLKLKDKLNKYFEGKLNKLEINYELIGTDFQVKVWKELLKIPYGKIVSYEFIANKINCKSSRAVANAISKNPLIFLVPCHRVIGKNGKLTGYAAGLDLKEYILKIENFYKTIT